MSPCVGISWNDGVGGGEVVDHSSDHPPHGSFPTGSPFRPDEKIFQTSNNWLIPKKEIREDFLSKFL